MFRCSLCISPSPCRQLEALANGRTCEPLGLQRVKQGLKCLDSDSTPWVGLPGNYCVKFLLFVCIVLLSLCQILLTQH